jgi:hypothetical protein
MQAFGRLYFNLDSPVHRITSHASQIPILLQNACLRQAGVDRYSIFKTLHDLVRAQNLEPLHHFRVPNLPSLFTHPFRTMLDNQN